MYLFFRTRERVNIAWEGGRDACSTNHVECTFFSLGTDPWRTGELGPLWRMHVQIPLAHFHMGEAKRTFLTYDGPRHKCLPVSKAHASLLGWHTLELMNPSRTKHACELLNTCLALGTAQAQTPLSHARWCGMLRQNNVFQRAHLGLAPQAVPETPPKRVCW